MNKWMRAVSVQWIVVIVFSSMFVHSMEKEVKKRHISSLKSICIKYISAHPDKVKILDNLADLSPKLAFSVVQGLQASYLIEHKETCVSLIPVLDHKAASFIAYQLYCYKYEINKELSTHAEPFASTDERNKRIAIINEYNTTICLKTLVRELIKKGPLTPSLASLMYHDFHDAEIPDNFDDLFNAHFPADIVQNNEELLYGISPIAFGPILQKSNNPFFVQEFESQTPVLLKKTGFPHRIEITCATNKHYKSVIYNLFFNLLGCDTILKMYLDSKHNILLIHYEEKEKSDFTVIKLLNLTTLLDVNITCPQKDQIQKIGFNSDCSQVAYMKTDGTICSYSIPKEFIYFVPSLKHRTFLSYISQKWRIVVSKMGTLNFNVSEDEEMKEIIKLPLVMMRELVRLIQKNEHCIVWSPYEKICGKIVSNSQYIYDKAKLKADALNIDIETLAEKLISKELSIDF